MADTTIKDIGDRFHLINQTITSVNSRSVSHERDFPQNFDSAHLPMLVPLYGGEPQRVEGTDDEILETQTWYVYAFIDTFEHGVPIQSTMRIAEPLIQAIKDTYDPRKKLQHSDNGLAWVDKAINTGNGGIQDLNGIAYIRFSFSLTVEHVETQL